MKTLVLLFHPDFQHSKVNRKLYDVIKNNENLIIRDMYALYPDFKIDVKKSSNIWKKRIG